MSGEEFVWAAQNEARSSTSSKSSDIKEGTWVNNDECNTESTNQSDSEMALQRMLGDLRTAEFNDDYWSKKPYLAHRKDPQGFCSMLSVNDLGMAAEHAPAENVLFFKVWLCSTACSTNGSSFNFLFLTVRSEITIQM